MNVWTIESSKAILQKEMTGTNNVSPIKIHLIDLHWIRTVPVYRRKRDSGHSFLFVEDFQSPYCDDCDA